MEDKSRPPPSGWRPLPWPHHDLRVRLAVFLPLTILPVFALLFHIIAESERPTAQALFLRPRKHPA